VLFLNILNQIITQMKKKWILITCVVFITFNSNLLVEAQEVSGSVIVRRVSGKIIIDGNLSIPADIY